METLLHPVSGVEILGRRLPPGTTLRKTDMYDSRCGVWGPCPVEGLILQHGCQTVWVRPYVELSLEAKKLLVYLEGTGFYVTNFLHWKVIPSPRWKQDPRMDWEIMHPKCVQELIEQGFLVECRNDSGVYEVSKHVC